MRLNAHYGYFVTNISSLKILLCCFAKQHRIEEGPVWKMLADAIPCRQNLRGVLEMEKGWTILQANSKNLEQLHSSDNLTKTFFYTELQFH